MSAIGQVDAGINTAYDTSTKKTSQTKTSYGNTVGDPLLSDKAAKYYEQLKKKYSIPNLNILFKIINYKIIQILKSVDKIQNRSYNNKCIDSLLLNIHLKLNKI